MLAELRRIDGMIAASIAPPTHVGAVAPAAAG
jgi:hypothetical protein